MSELHRVIARRNDGMWLISLSPAGILRPCVGGEQAGMELIRGRHNLRPHHRGCAVTIGAFDGVHLGHQAVLAHLKAEAYARGVQTTVVTFEPLPREYLRPLEAPPRITTLRDKWPLLEACGVDHVLCLPFNERLRQLSAREFVEQVFVEGLGVKYLAFGDDFRFGNRREGDLIMSARWRMSLAMLSPPRLRWRWRERAPAARVFGMRWPRQTSPERSSCLVGPLSWLAGCCTVKNWADSSMRRPLILRSIVSVHLYMVFMR